MPRKGMGQKVQTATGQEYGQAKMQEEAQETIPCDSSCALASPYCCPVTVLAACCPFPFLGIT